MASHPMPESLKLVWVHSECSRRAVVIDFHWLARGAEIDFWGDTSLAAAEPSAPDD